MTDRPLGAEGLSEYKAAVDRALTTLCGVGYSTLVDDMAPGMDRNGVLLRYGHDRLGAAEFAHAFQRLHNLARADVSGREWAEQFNLSRAALLSFATERRNWQVGTDSRGYLAVDGGHALRLDIANKNDKWGFVVSESVEPVGLVIELSDRLHRVAVPDGAFAKLSARLDVGDAVADAMRLRAQRRVAAEAAPEAEEPQVSVLRRA